MIEVIGSKNMKKLISFLLTTTFVFAADNEIYIDQSGATANIDLEQLGSGNIIGGLDSVAPLGS